MRSVRQRCAGFTMAGRAQQEVRLAHQSRLGRHGMLRCSLIGGRSGDRSSERGGGRRSRLGTDPGVGPREPVERRSLRQRPLEHLARELCLGEGPARVLWRILAGRPGTSQAQAISLDRGARRVHGRHRRRPKQRTLLFGRGAGPRGARRVRFRPGDHSGVAAGHRDDGLMAHVFGRREHRVGRRKPQVLSDTRDPHFEGPQGRQGLAACGGSCEAAGVAHGRALHI
mmetsp:Transcript_4950/g.14489  ORF Transcript_4950/g.14489 Transcript_4950/m.14489 type:complete len:227 (+) Transcript_4950:97-777(+)